jgi:hypothetical protein
MQEPLRIARRTLLGLSHALPPLAAAQAVLK